jgi:hypothetical protein
LEDAKKWSAALAILRERVKPIRDKHPKTRERTQWWKLSRSVRALFSAIEPLQRFMACPAQSKRFHMIWCEPYWCPSNLTSAFALEDDYAFGVLNSSIHTRWATDRSTTLETRPRYTVNSYITFPWPGEPGDADKARVEALGRSIDAERQRICSEGGFGLTALYNAIDEGAHVHIADLHRELDLAVAHAYGWPDSAADDPARQEQLLLDLNFQRTTAPPASR